MRVELIRSSSGAGTGYLLLDIERSERRPHRAESKGKKAYFKRVGDSFFEMEHYDIEDAFKRSQVANLSFRWSAQKGTISGPEFFKATIKLQLENKSYQTARFPYLHIQAGKHVRFASIASPENYRSWSDSGWIHFTGDANNVINPETKSSIVALEIEIGIKDNIPMTIEKISIHDFSIFFYCRYGCENSRCTEEEVILKGNDILTQVHWSGS